MNGKDVFISYKAEEYDEAKWVKTELEKNGISCWMAPMSIIGGASYATEIPKAIKACKAFVLILSEKAQNSKWVPRELDQAINAGKIILPFVLEDCRLKDDFNFYLTNVQCYFAYKNKAAEMNKMIAEIKSNTGISDSNEEYVSFEDNTVESDKNKKQTLKPEKKSSSSEKKRSFKKSEKKKAQHPKTKKRKAPLIISAAVLSVAVLIAVVFIVNSLDDVTIAGERFDGNAKSVYINDADFSTDDLESLGKLNKLYVVNFENCTFPDYEIGKYIPATTTTLKLINCGLTDSHIASIDFEKLGLNNLELANNPQISNLQSLSALSETLYSLNISGTGVSDVDFLKNFSKLYLLQAENCKLSNLHGLADCKALLELYVSNNNLNTLQGLEKCIKLKKISADGNSITSLQGIENATVLETADFCDNKLSDISVLSKSSKSIKDVRLSKNELSDISALKDCTLISRLELDNNELTDLDALKNLTELSVLSASENKLNSIEGISSCNKLSYIDLSDNGITDTSGFPEITLTDNEFLKLDLSNNKIKNLALSNNGYYFLALNGNEISDYSKLFELKIIKIVVDYDASIDFDSAANSELLDAYVINCPLDKQISVETSAKKYTVDFIDQTDAENIIDEYMKK